MILPGIGGGMGGIAVRYPLVVILAMVTLDPKSPTPVPPDIAVMAAHITTEILFGAIVATVPLLLVTGMSTAGQIASGSIGLNGAQMFDPTTSTSLSDLSRIYSDLGVILFLSMNGHHVAIAQLAGLGEVVQPGSFVITGLGIQTIVDLSSKIFEIGVMVASPVIVALLLTNFVMGLLSKVVSGFNVFMVSFYVTIGIGFILSMLALPEVYVYLSRHMYQLEALTRAVSR
jgi:flagellar biosynthetic protein FliR